MSIIAGVDEVGRSPLAGPVLASAVILGKARIGGIKDSKLLTKKKRMELCAKIKQKSICWSIGIATVREIEELNVFYASLLAMKRALDNLPVVPQLILVDGIRCPESNIESRAIIRGDKKIREISAASIVAKVTRDYLMTFFDHTYPQYGFSKHKGYPTRFHLQALASYGITPLHRRNFLCIKMALEKELSLFDLLDKFVDQLA